jgi:hypothetical protein
VHERESLREMAKKKASWGLIILGVVVLVVVVFAGLMAVAGYFVYKQFAFEAAPATEISVEQEFARVLDRFKGQQPFIQMRDGEPVETIQPSKATAVPSHPIEALHVLVWQPDERKVFRMNIPFWILRMSKGRPVHLGRELTQDGEPFQMKVTADDIERRGPGLILDFTKPGRERVLVWAE